MTEYNRRMTRRLKTTLLTVTALVMAGFFRKSMNRGCSR